MLSNSLATVWLYEVPTTKDTNSQRYRHAFVQPQSITQASSGSAGNLTIAYNSEILKTTNDLNLGDATLLANEYVCIKKFIIQYTGGNWTIRAVIDVTGNKVSQ